MNFDVVMDELVRKMGIGSLKVDDKGSFSLLFDDEHELFFTPDKDDRSILFYAEIGDISNLHTENYQHLLSASLLGAETEGATFALNKNLGKLVLWKRYSENFEDLTNLEQAINVFLGQVIAWKEKFNTAISAAQGDKSEPTTYANVFVNMLRC